MMSNSQTNQDTFLRLFETSAGEWVGCDWPTEFGSSQLNLAGMTASRALIVARATSGSERAAWEQAAHWLAEVESDAVAAQQQAQLAAGLAEAGKLVEAKYHIQQATDLESKYRPPAIWLPLQNAIFSACGT